MKLFDKQFQNRGANQASRRYLWHQQLEDIYITCYRDREANKAGLDSSKPYDRLKSKNE